MAIAELIGDEDSDGKSRTYVLNGEDHTLGNALQTIIVRYPEVSFCGYSAPHPSENKILFRIQSRGPKAVDLLIRGLLDLEQQCNSVMKAFNEAMTDYKADTES